MLTMNEVLQKVLDNANLGKMVTDVAPGFALSLSFLMMVSLWSGVSVTPADQLKNLNEDLKATKVQVIQAKLCMKSLMAYQECKMENLSNEQWLKKESDADQIYVQARRRMADLAAAVDDYNAQKSKGAVEENVKRDFRLAEQLGAQKEVVDERIANLEKLQNLVTDSRSLEYNLIGFTQNISSVIAFSVVFGILLSQISHLLFVDIIFPMFRKVKDHENHPISIQQSLSKEDDELVKNYYRYVEGAINMVFPSVLFGFVFPSYVELRLGLDLPFNTLLVYVWWLFVGLLLAYSGLQTYISFLKKRVSLAVAIAGGFQPTPRI